MFENLHLLAYNNYYNRQVKRESAYISYQEYELFTNNSVNFNPNDHINTVVKVTLNNASLATPSYSVEDAIEQINYLVVTDITNSIINSRWFIIDAKREGTTSWHVSLRRDVVADNYHTILDAPVFIEKGTPNANNPLLFNRENMGYNQIKKGEWLLKDKTKCPWLVGYYSKKIDEGSDNALTGTVERDSPSIVSLGVEHIEEWKFAKHTSEDFFILPAIWTFEMYINFQQGTVSGNEALKLTINNDTRVEDITDNADDRVEGNFGNSFKNLQISDGQVKNAKLAIKNTGIAQWDVATALDWYTYEDYLDFIQYQYKYVSTGDGKVYEIIYRNTGAQTKSQALNPVGSLCVNKINPALEELGYINVAPNNNSYKISAYVTTYKIEIVEQTALEAQYDISVGRACEDEVYNLFAIPYGEIKAIKNGVEKTINNPELALNLARQIQKNGGSNIYDVQLLPYCPCVDLINDDGSLSGDAHQISWVSDVNEDIMLVAYPNRSNFNIFNLDIYNSSTSQLNWDDVPKYGNVEQLKTISECDELRLVSPNYNGQFSFNIARNNGIIGFTADCTYKPYSPYIHVNPIFGGLYGQDFNDARGLICQGDFSISAITDAWTQYEINNKNYNNIFNREIQSMEFNNSIQQGMDIVTAVTGTISASVTGAAGGALVGGGAGAIAGGIIGGAASAIGGGLDIYYNQQMRNEQLDLKRDMYGYQLGNIKALPYSLSKVSALNENNKLFPFVEYYTCTEKEKQALRNKLKYNGYTIMAIDNIPNYSPVNVETYIKGRVIRFNDQIESHTAYAINEELQSGIFIERNDSEV